LIRHRSKKTEGVYRERRKLVAYLLDAIPVCQRCHSARSTECHEIVTRARGGSILDVDNIAILCSTCHRWITEHPAEATAEGWMKHSWERDGKGDSN
jgi:5-methylcytosine-specific restriction protein A